MANNIISFLTTILLCMSYPCASSDLNGNNLVRMHIVDGVLSAVVDTQQHFEVDSQGSTIITLQRISCGHELLECVLPKHISIITTDTDKVSLPAITYNSEFQLEITRGVRTFATFFSTPQCRNADTTFTVCEDGNIPEPTHETIIKSEIFEENVYTMAGLCIILFMLVIFMTLILIHQHITYNHLLTKVNKLNEI